MFIVPEKFVANILSFHEAEGQRWLERLPAILNVCQQKWDITIGPPVSNLSFHYVAPAVQRDGTPVMVKIAAPTGEFVQESEALRLFAGHGMARLLACDAENEAMLLEQLRPGMLLTALEDDEQAISAAASVMRQLWRPAPAQHPFPTVADWGRGFVRLRQHYDGGHGPFPKALLEEAEALYAEMTATMEEPVLLHGDLHQENILSAERVPWLAIDPKGLIGEPAYETGAILRNPLPGLLSLPNPGRILARRIDQLSAELNLDRQRVRNWAMSQAVLSLWWVIEDFGTFSQAGLACCELLAAIK